jgi:hypothetical protein
MIMNWIKKLFVKTSPIQPKPAVEAIARKPNRKKNTKQVLAMALELQQSELASLEVARLILPEKKRRGRPFGSKNRGPIVSKLKSIPTIRKGEKPSNFKVRLKRWEARNDPTKIKGDKNKLGQSARNMANTNKP